MDTNSNSQSLAHPSDQNHGPKRAGACACIFMSQLASGKTLDGPKKYGGSDD